MAIDLFGLGKQQPEEPETPVTPEPAPEPPRGSHRLWAFLLVLDSIFLIVFAGGVAMKIYQHWKAPAQTVVQPRKRTAKEQQKTAEAPAASTAAPAAAADSAKTVSAETAAKTPAPEKAPEKTAAAPAPEKPKTPAAAPVENMRPPKPSLLADAPRHRGTPGLADPSSARGSAAPAPAGAETSRAPGKAIPVEFKLRAPRAQSVALVGAFIVRGGRRDMSRHGDGTWSITLYLNPGDYRYFFSVDKKKQLDPENPRSERGASVLSVP